MKTGLFHSAWLVVFAVLGVPSNAAVSAVSSAAVQEDRLQELKTKFVQAAKINSKDEMANLVRKYNDEAIQWIIATAESISNQPSDQLYERMAQLRTAWKTSVKTDFAEEIEKYFSLLHPAGKRERTAFKRDYGRKINEYNASVGAQDAAQLRVIGTQFEALAKKFESVGDRYHASEAWGYVYLCSREDHVGDAADKFRQAKAAGELVRNREAIDLRDGLHGTYKSTYTMLVNQGFGPEGEAGAIKVGERPGEAAEAGAGGAAPRAKPAGPSAAGAPIVANMGFEAIEMEAVERPNYNLDNIYQCWMVVALDAKGSTGKFDRVNGGPAVHRVAAADLRVDSDGDGEGEVKIPMTGNFELVEFSVGSGDDQRPWAVVATTGIPEDTYQGIQAFLAPTDVNMQLYYAPAGSLIGDIDGTRVRVIDEDLDGFYGGASLTWGWFGLTPDNFHPEMDSMVIGKSKRAVPYSEFQQIGDTWYKLAPAKHGQEMTKRRRWNSSPVA